jgi:dipeptidyl-peptidase-4
VIVRRLSFLILLSLLSFAHAQIQTSSPNKQLTIESIFSPGGITGAEPEAIHWSPDQTKFSYILRDDSGEHGELWSVDATTGEKKLLVTAERLALLAPPVGKLKDDREKDQITRYHVAPYRWAPDSKHLLFAPHGQLWLYDIATGTAVQMSAAPEPSRDPKFSPDGKNLAYVREHNLYVQSVAGNSLKQLTKDKDPNLLNGEVDWVYAEELSVRSNYFWSPDGRKLAFLQMDETQVPTYPITDWMPVHPKVDEEKYPKAGDPNPVVRLGIVGSSSGKIKWFSLIDKDRNKDEDKKDIYIPRFGWLDPNTVWAEVLNRTQDQMDFYFVDAGSGKSRKVLTESVPGGWVNVNDDFTVLGSKGQFLWTSWRDGHTHIYLYSYDRQSPLASDAKLEKQLTRGDFEVLAVQGVDEASGTIYFTCNKDDPRQQQIYSVKLDGSELQRVSREDGFHDPTFADNGKHYLDDYSSQLSPPRFSMCSNDGACRPFADSRKVDQFGLVPFKQMEFKAEDGTKLYGQLLLLPNSTADTKLPLVVYIYGGPWAQTVQNKWIGDTGLFHEFLAQHGFAIFSVDNRGTPARDRKFQTAIRHEYGAVELRDQLAALDQLLAANPQLDPQRVAIWGWSNGGSMTLYSLTHSDRFRAGVSVAPVTDWHNYDSIYTERYLGLPAQNPKAYADSSMPKAADKLHGALLLAHGTEDDNVHFQNSIQMTDALIRAGKQFRFMPYPNKTHGIEGPEYRTHLFHMIEDHFEHELK